MNPVCCTCSQEMKCSKTGRVVVLDKPADQVLCINGDEFQCSTCGARIVKFEHDNSYWCSQGLLPKGTIDISEGK